MFLIHLASIIAISAGQTPIGTGGGNASVGTGNQQLPTGYIWRGYGGDPYHNAISTVAGQPVSKLHWKTALDGNRTYYGSVLFIHYASPAITAGNTIIHSYRYTTTPGGVQDNDNWTVQANNGAGGTLKWAANTDYSAPVVWPTDWTSVFPLGLVGTNTAAWAGAGGTVMMRANADAFTSPITRTVFYTSLNNYNANPSAFAGVKINTPFTSDANGNLWFGYEVDSPVSGSIGQQLGTGGIVRIDTSGGATFRSVNSMTEIDSSLGQTATNSAPALSRDGSSVYFAVREPGSSGEWVAYLGKFNSMTLATQASVRLWDPSLQGQAGAGVINESSAAPMVGPDGHVFYGVFGYYWRESHGWMLQFDGNLNQYDSNNKRYPVGAFGWDDTASVVASSLVPSYTGSASYLVLSKYNDYAINTPGQPYGQGQNRVAVLDPTNDSNYTDWQTGINCMDPVISVLCPTPDPSAIQEGYTNAVHEWCINSAVIDPANDSAIINCEDGNCYRWSFASNSLTQALNIAPATSEAYTSTVIGPDGTIYACNNSFLCAIGK